MALLLAHHLRVFTTGDVMMLTHLRKDAASHSLRRLEIQGVIQKIKRGVWISKLVQDLSPSEVLIHLTAPWPSYVSLESALAQWGIISQIPSVIYGVTAGKPMKCNTPLGVFHIRHINRRLFGNYIFQGSSAARYPIATPEKALLDTLYFRYRLGGKPNFKEWNWRKLDRKKLKQLARNFPLSIQQNIPRP